MLCLVQVLSYNLYTVLNIPHDPVALEEHFQDDDEGPVSNHGYMPYLNKYILDKVENKEKVIIHVKYSYIILSIFSNRSKRACLTKRSLTTCAG